MLDLAEVAKVGLLSVPGLDDPVRVFSEVASLNMSYPFS